MVSVTQSDSALTTETPTPQAAGDFCSCCCQNLPPACQTVMMTSAAEWPSFGWMPVGIPRPLSATLTELSAWMVTVIFCRNVRRALRQWRCRGTSNTMWCRPLPSCVCRRYTYRGVCVPLPNLQHSYAVGAVFFVFLVSHGLFLLNFRNFSVRAMKCQTGAADVFRKVKIIGNYT